MQRNDCLLKNCSYGVFGIVTTKGEVITSEWDLRLALSLKSEFLKSSSFARIEACIILTTTILLISPLA